jgi:hypothetical protein
MKDADYSLPAALDVYRKDGTLLREKARMLAETWVDQIYPRLVDPDTPTPQLLDIGKELFKLGDLLPKTNAPTGPTGPAFSITINVPTGPTQTITISDVSEDDTIEGEYQVTLPPVEEVAPEEVEEEIPDTGPDPIPVRGFDV